MTQLEIKLIETILKPEIEKLHEKIKYLENENADLKKQNEKLLNKILA
jgi:FtsZ-binding cell division protein ZapB